jgi:hypothetical protein
MRICPSHVAQLQQGWGSSLPHFCTEKGLTPATSAPKLGSPHANLHQDWAHSMPHLDQD